MKAEDGGDGANGLIEGENFSRGDEAAGDFLGAKANVIDAAGYGVVEIGFALAKKIMEAVGFGGGSLDRRVDGFSVEGDV